MIFFNFNKKKEIKEQKRQQEKYLSCRFLNGGISFMHTAIKTCCHSKDGIIFYKDYKGEKINAFNNVIENVKKYLSCSPFAPMSIISKYIIINGVNDNIEELDNWLNKMKEIGIKNTKLELDLREFDIKIQGKKETAKPQYYEMYEHYKKRIDELNMNDESTAYTKLVLEEGGLPKGYQ